MGADSLTQLKPVPFDHRNNPSVIVAWLKQNAPCLVGQIPHAWTDKIIQHLRSQFVPDALIGNVLVWARENGYHFAVTITSAQLGYNFKYQPPSNTPTVTQQNPGDKERGAKLEAQSLEEKYLKAQRSNDREGMVEAAEAFYNLLGRFPPGKPMPGRLAMQNMREKWLEGRGDILRNAPNLAQLVRQLGPLEPRLMRDRIRTHTQSRVTRSTRRVR